jgi:integrase
MAKPIRLTPINTDKGWRLNIPPKLSETGRRQQLFFRTQVLAKAAADDLKAKREEFGSQARAISPTIAEQATKAHSLLLPFGITVLEAAERIAGMERAAAASVPIETALEAFTLAKESKSAKQQQAIRHAARHLCEDFAGRRLCDITGDEVGKHLDSRTSGPAAFNAKMRLLTTFWRWCAKKPRQWCDAAELSHVERKETTPGEIIVLKSKEAAALMAAAEKHFPETVIPFAVALFAGLRQAEIARLIPEDITADGITVPALNDRKNKRRRFIGMPAPLAAWLEEYPIGETVIPTNWPEKYDAVRRLAGWRLWCDLIKPPAPPENLPKWGHNALRDTAATVALGLGKTLETLVFEHGHTGKLETLRSHYIGKMTRAEAVKIWAIGPHGTKIPNLKIA